jgi:hypothetical protein
MIWSPHTHAHTHKHKCNLSVWRFCMHCRTQTFHTRYCYCYLFIPPSLPPARPPFSVCRFRMHCRTQTFRNALQNTDNNTDLSVCRFHSFASSHAEHRHSTLCNRHRHSTLCSSCSVERLCCAVRIIACTAEHRHSTLQLPL